MNRTFTRQCGWTMIEMMISITLGLVIMLILTHLLLSTKTAYSAQEQNVGVHETGRYASEIIARAIRQTGYEHFGAAPATISIDMSPNIAGYDGATLKKNTPDLTAPSFSNVVNGSDVLALRFFGEGQNEEGSIINCAGLAVPGVDPLDVTAQDRGWSIFFVAEDSSGEPELRCKYQTRTGWNAEAIARGVESFQVLYGVDTQGDDGPDRFVNADGLDLLDATLKLDGSNAVERAHDLNRKTYWKEIRAIRFSVLIRGSQRARDDALDHTYDLFDAEYSRMHGADDHGVFIQEADLPVATRAYIRKVFTQTIQLRNDPAGSQT